MPNDLTLDITSEVETRFRGIAPARISRHHAALALSFGGVPSTFWRPERKIVSAYVVVFTGQRNSITAASATLDGTAQVLHNLDPQAWCSDWHSLAFDVAYDKLSQPLTVKLEVTVGGGDTLALAPLGHTSVVNLRSNWAHVKFVDQLPATREFSSTAVAAHWQTSALSTRLRSSYSNASLADLANSLNNDQITLQFIEPLDIFAMLDRSTKYGMLIVVVTLGFVLLFDFTRDTRMHLAQYGVVTFGLVLFFMLLLALSEHAGFNVAFVIGSGAIAVLSSAYLFMVFRSLRLGASFAGYFAVCYGALYTILRSEDYALLLGSALLLVGLAVAMWFTSTLHARNDTTTTGNVTAPPPLAPR
jgi:inner membrane protein involved in colicin E2 resistance